MPTLKMKLVFTMARQAEALNLQIVAYHGYGDMWTWGHVDMWTCAHVDMGKCGHGDMSKKWSWPPCICYVLCTKMKIHLVTFIQHNLVSQSFIYFQYPSNCTYQYSCFGRFDQETQMKSNCLI